MNEMHENEFESYKKNMSFQPRTSKQRFLIIKNTLFANP